MKRQQIEQLYNKLKGKNQILKIPKWQAVGDKFQIGQDQYEDIVRSLWVDNDQLNFSQFYRIYLRAKAMLLQNKGNKGSQLFIIQLHEQLLKASQKFIKYLNDRKIVVKDRGCDAYFTIKVGNHPQQQAYKNHIKLKLKKQQLHQQNKIIKPSLSIILPIKAKKQQQQQQQQNLTKAQQILQQIMKLAWQFKTKLMQNYTSNEQSKLMKSLHENISYHINKISGIGIQIRLQFQSFQLLQALKSISLTINKVLNTSVQAQFNAAIKFDKNLMDILDIGLSKFNFVQTFTKDFQVSISAELGLVMSAIKQIIIKSRQFDQLKYKRFYPPSMLAILFSNMQFLQTVVQLNNIQLLEQQKKLYEPLLQKIRLKQFIEDMQQFYPILQEYKLDQLIQILGEEIVIKLEGADLLFQFRIRIYHLGQMLKKLFGVTKVAGK